jgi:hypothetical protein
MIKFFMLYIITYMAEKNSNILKKLIPQTHTHTSNVRKTAFVGPNIVVV